MKISFSHILIFFLIVGGIAQISWAQEALPLNNSFHTAGLRPLVELSDYWRDQVGRSYNVPFTEPEQDELVVDQVFYIDSLQSAPDTLLLYFGGIAWSSEIYLNDRLISITEDPFIEQIFSLPRSLFNAGRNQITVKLLKQGLSFDFYPEKFAGIVRQAALMVPDTLNRIPVVPEIEKSPSKVVIYAPWSKTGGFQPDPAGFWSDLALLESSGVKTIYFPFRPHGKYLVMMKKAGFSQATSLSEVEKVAFFNEYPIQTLPKSYQPQFWRNQAGEKTEHFGTYQTISSQNTGWIQEPFRPALIIILVLPLIGVLMMKLLSPKIYLALPEYITKSKIYIDLIGKSKFLRTPETILMNVFRMILVSVMISVPLYYVQCFGNQQWLNILSTRSLIFQIFSESSLTLFEYFGLSFLFVLIINSIKYAFTYFLGLTYRVQGFSSEVQNLDVFLYFPLSIFQLLPVAFLFFVAPDTVKLIGILWLVIFIAVSIRRLWLSFLGLGTLFKLPVSLKFLYICAFEILPWIILI